MFYKTMIALLLFAAFSTMSFTRITTMPVAPLQGNGGNALSVANATPGTAVMSWSFSQAGTVYSYIIDDVVHRQVVSSGQTSQTSKTVTGLAPGTYRFSVSNGSSIIIIEDVVH